MWVGARTGIVEEQQTSFYLLYYTNKKYLCQTYAYLLRREGDDALEWVAVSYNDIYTERCPSG